jgi:hypothetical protein
MTDHMPDGNSAAERRRDASESKAEAKWERWEKRAREDIVDDLMSGKSVSPRKVALQDLISDVGVEYVISAEDLVMLSPRRKKEIRSGALYRLESAFIKLCHDWLDTPQGQDYLGERIDSMDEES